MAIINVSELTTKAVDGTGVFDTLMQATNAQVIKEFESGRISGNDYASVYLGALQSTLAQSVTFLLQKQQADKQADLLAAQVTSSGIQDQLTEQQKLNLIAEALGIEANTDLTVQQKANLVTEELKLDEEIALLTQQLANLTATKDKIDSEAALINQKKLTEEAQTEDIVDGSSVVGVIGKQKDLYTAQTSGFARDAEQKFSKIMADVYAVQRGTDESLIPPEGAQHADISKVLLKAAEGIGVTITI